MSTCSIAQSANSTKHTSKKQNSLRNLLSCLKVLRMLSPPLFIQGSILNVEIVVLNYQKCNQCRKGHKSPGLLFRGNGWYITTFTHGSCIWLFWAEVHWFKNLEFLPFCLFGGLCRPKNLVSGPCRSQGLQRAPGACGPEGLRQSFPPPPLIWRTMHRNWAFAGQSWKTRLWLHTGKNPLS